MRQNRFWYVREIPFPNIRNPQGTDFLKEKSSRNPAHWHLLSWLIYLMRRAKHTRKPIRRMNSNMITVDLKSKFKHDYNRSEKYIQTWLITMDLNSKLRHDNSGSEKNIQTWLQWIWKVNSNMIKVDLKSISNTSDNIGNGSEK